MSKSAFTVNDRVRILDIRATMLGTVIGIKRKRVRTGMSWYIVKVLWDSGSIGRHEETRLLKVARN